MSIFGDRLMTVLSDKQMTQRELGKLAKITSSAVCNYINGTRDPSIRTLVKICDVLNVSADDLLYDKKHY